jgi:hypothetical protein
MARRTKPTEEPEIPKSGDPATGIELLQRQIKKAEKMLASRPIIKTDHTAWENTTRDYLIKAWVRMTLVDTKVRVQY